MLSDLLWAFLLLFFIVYGIKRPYIALSGVVFVDILKPQVLSFSFLAGKPISLIMTLVLLTSMFINIKQLSIPKKLWPVILICIFMVWITITTYHAYFQLYAWHKYNFVIKAILFSLFIPFVINSRIKFDTFIAILICSISYFTIALGMTTAIGGGGYGNTLFNANTSNTGMTESSTMAMVAVMNIPLIIYITNHSIFKDEINFTAFFSKLLIFASIMSVIGTFARTGLIGLFVYGGLQLKRSKKKIRYMSIAMLIFAIAVPFAPQSWLDRMSTINSASDDSSAFGRIVVWKWTLDFVKDNPIYGGGFNAHIANAGQLEQYIDTGMEISHTQTGKAFHNIYFEVWGEHGYPGLLIFLWLIWYVFKTTSTYMKRKKHPVSPHWITHASTAIHDALLIYCVCGLFIGVAYYPWLYYFVALTASLAHISINDNPKDKKKAVRS